MADDFKFEINSPGVQQLLQSDAVRALIRPAAEAAATAARANVPVETGDLQNSIRIQERTTDRAVFDVVAGGPSAPYAAVVEARTGFLNRALNAAGGSRQQRGR